MAVHTRTHDEEDLPHATKRYVALTSVEETKTPDPPFSGITRTMADHLRKYEQMCV